MRHIEACPSSDSSDTLRERKTASLPLKINGWKIIFVFFFPKAFSGATLVLGRVCTIQLAYNHKYTEKYHINVLILIYMYMPLIYIYIHGDGP